jgi:hypothetical protein
MLCGLPTVQQAAVCCLSFDPFPFDQNGLAAPEVDAGGRQIADTLVISQMIVVSDVGFSALIKPGKTVVEIQGDSFLSCFAPAVHAGATQWRTWRATSPPMASTILSFCIKGKF